MTGSLGWVARQCRPDLSYAVSHLQGKVCQAEIKDLKNANRAVKQAKDFSTEGLYYCSDAISWDSAVVVTVTDASFAGETVIEPSGIEKPHRTQKAFMILLVDPAILTGHKAGCHIWC